MRIQNKHEYKNYLGNRRIAYIQKGNHRLHTLIQFVNNDLVDKLVIEAIKKSVIFVTLTKLTLYNPHYLITMQGLQKRN